jgi:hypothetical protein
MGRHLCTVVILLSSFYAWLMTATGIQLTQYRPAFAGMVGAAQPYILAGLVHIAITYFYLRLSSPYAMTRRQMISLLAATPLVVVFVVWTVFMSSYSIMFERRSETAQIESENRLQSIAEELRSIDRQMAGTYLSTLTNLGQRLENEINRPEPGVKQGCGKRCREIRSVQSELQNFQHLQTPLLSPFRFGSDLARALGTLENEQQQVLVRLSDFEAALGKFSGLNAVLAERLVNADEISSRLSDQFRTQIQRVGVKLAELRDNDRNLTDTKYRGMNELVNDVRSALASGQVARILDMFTVILIAVAPDFLNLIMALLSRSLSRGEEAATSGGMADWWKRKRLWLSRRGQDAELEKAKALVKAHLAERGRSGELLTAPLPKPPDPEELPPVKEPESVYEQLDKMELPISAKRRRLSGH